MILDLYRITSVDDAAAPLLQALGDALRRRGGKLAISNASHLTLPLEPHDELPTFETLEQAVEWATHT